MTTKDLNIRGEGAATIRRIERALPATWFSSLPVAQRVELMVEDWYRTRELLQKSRDRREVTRNGTIA